MQGMKDDGWHTALLRWEYCPYLAVDYERIESWYQYSWGCSIPIYSEGCERRDALSPVVEIAHLPQTYLGLRVILAMLVKLLLSYQRWEKVFCQDAGSALVVHFH